MIRYTVYFLAVGLLFLTACGGSSKKKWTKNPVDEYITKLDKEKTFSIVLHDMDFDDDNYKHKYKIITNLTDSVKRKEEITAWKNVSEEYFMKNENNLGMELISKNEEGKISKIPAPPGYSNYVGNKQYGQWQTNSSGQSFWAFYGQYAFMSSMFGMMSTPVYRNGYNDYRSNYYGRRPYYGQNGRTYGTYGTATKSSNPNFFQRNRNKTTSFKNRLNTRRSRGSSRSSSSSSSSRSRSSSFGK